MNSRDDAKAVSRQNGGKVGESAQFVLEGQGKMKEALKELARRIRVWRARQGLTQESFSAKCGISVSFASLLERGERSPSYETLVRISQALEIPLSHLFRSANDGAFEDPAYLRLLEFARRRRLSATQVDRLIKVGQALFDEERTSSTNNLHARPGGGTCHHEGCSRPVLAKGLCASHYHRARRARL
jgi:transcriptional regulator with XRE-family HTH domain